MVKRNISLLLTVITVILLVPVTALAGAETVYPVWVAGIQVTKSNMADVLGSADGNAKTVTFNPQTNTLTLNGATLAETGSATGFGYGNNNVRGVKSELEALTVNLIGTNRIGKEISADSPLEDYSVDMGLSGTGNITFTGNADSKLIIYDYCVGIQAKNVIFGENFKGKLTVRDSGGAEPMPPCAINATGKFDDSTYDYISDGNVTILCGTFDLVSYCSNCIVADGNITVSGASLTADAAYAAIESGSGNITVKNATLTVKGDAAIDCNSGNILIDNVNLKAVATGREGICSSKNITVTNCAKVDISGADEAIYASKKVSITNCPDVKLESDQLSTITADDISVVNSSVAVTAHNGYDGLVANAGEDSDGEGSITVKDSKLTVKAEGNGINCRRFSVSGGKSNVYSAGDTDGDGKGCGALIKGDESAISVTRSTVKLTGGEAGIKLQLKSDASPFTGSLPNVSFTGNTEFDTFTPMQSITYSSEKSSGTFSEYPYIGDKIAKSVAVIHAHNIVKVNGVAATEKHAGFKNYYKCDCGKYFEDAKGNVEIADIEKWKAKGGRGYLPQLSPSTGDKADMTVWALLICAAFAGLAFCGIAGAKKYEILR